MRPVTRRGRGTLAKLVGALIVTLLIAAVVGTLTITDDESADETTTTGPPTLSGAAAELAELLETRQTVAYHARYEGRSAEASTIVIETWQDGEGLVRQDQILSTAEQAAHLVSIDGGAEGPIRCNQLAETEWTCRRAAQAEADASDPIAAMRARLAEGEVTAETTQIDGSPARCFQLVAEGQESELCVRPDTGIPVRIGAAATELRLVIFEEDVDPAVFEPPGPVT
jgi:hypothetical protein